MAISSRADRRSFLAGDPWIGNDPRVALRRMSKTHLPSSTTIRGFWSLCGTCCRRRAVEALICREWEDAHAFVKEQRPALLILDIRIGGEERGWTILNLLTLDPDTRPIPVIVCSAAIQSPHTHQDLLSKFGICALPKPFGVDALLETVARMLPNGPAGSEQESPHGLGQVGRERICAAACLSRRAHGHRPVQWAGVHGPPDVRTKAQNGHTGKQIAETVASVVALDGSGGRVPHWPGSLRGVGQ